MWENDLSVSIKCITYMRKEKQKMITMHIPATRKGNYNTYMQITLYNLFTK